ncbi:LysM peptidoglycan-binding domain-containing protein [uncultured Clostridium sp.]|uniref:LysM peptidoglycan-binding domain-containing protein n=1 Tax=uncultured Clostridium sp. TaxID=59620 RepID=UPI0025F007B1|nr:LysM domain-containing protein [uncultured Clostridium sp.]
MRKLYLKSLIENKEILFPVTPFITYNYKMSNQTQDLFGFGEIGTGATSILATWTAKSFFPHPDNEYDFNLNPKSVGFFVNTLWGWMTKQHPLLLRYYDDITGNVTRQNCKITGFSYGEEDGSRDVKYTIEFQEYKKLELNNSKLQETNKIVYNNSTTYTVQDGDTILIIASKVYGDSTRYVDIMKNNNLTNPLGIKVGDKLNI